MFQNPPGFLPGGFLCVCDRLQRGSGGCGTKTDSAKKAFAKEKREIEIHSGLKTVQSKKALQITWGSVSGADGYNVYAQYCGEKFDAGSLNQVMGGKKTKITVKKINGKKAVR